MGIWGIMVVRNPTKWVEVGEESAPDHLMLARVGSLEPMFLGEYTHTLDEKGRLTLPARWREQLGLSVVITRGLDQCLFLFPSEQFHKVAEEIDQLGFNRSDVRGLSRYLFAKAIEVEPDRQGRIIVTPALRQFACIQNEAVIIGANGRIEIWSPELYMAADAAIEADAAAVSERIGTILERALQKKAD